MSLQTLFRETLFNSETLLGRVLELVLLVCILASVLESLLDSVPTLHQDYQAFFGWSEYGFTFLFTLEYGLRLGTAERPFRYALSFFGLIDLVAILPSFLGLFVIGFPSLSVFRALRFLRIFRILKLLRFSEEAKELLVSLKSSFRKITVFLGFVLILTVIIGSLMYFVEGSEHGFSSIPQSVYWTIVTMTTVGYGDIAPQTALGKLLASAVMLLGYGIIAVPTGAIVQGLSQSRLGFGPPSLGHCCPNCRASGHDADANHCKYCGTLLGQESGLPGGDR
ncbi:ion transporter [Synechocystis sp. LKSZ1]|uniref:ion transporter n=1 Tax=Synechocystis sp. LKSZ1 TaxID=3144951 RepID=UPI00336BCE82